MSQIPPPSRRGLLISLAAGATSLAPAQRGHLDSEFRRLNRQSGAARVQRPGFRGG